MNWVTEPNNTYSNLRAARIARAMVTTMIPVTGICEWTFCKRRHQFGSLRMALQEEGRKSLPRHENELWRELDSCTSSDALLMSVAFRNEFFAHTIDHTEATPSGRRDAGKRAAMLLLAFHEF